MVGANIFMKACSGGALQVVVSPEEDAVVLALDPAGAQGSAAHTTPGLGAGDLPKLLSSLSALQQCCIMRYTLAISDYPCSVCGLGLHSNGL